VAVVLDGFYDQVGNGWLEHVERAGAGLIQEAVQCGKGLSRAEHTRRKRAMRGQTAVQPPGEKHRLFRGVDVRKPAPVEHAAKITVTAAREFSTGAAKPTRGSAADLGVRPTSAMEFSLRVVWRYDIHIHKTISSD